MDRQEDGEALDGRGTAPIVFEALWSGVVNDWDNADRHTRFLDHARASGGLHEAARRYASLRSDEARREVAVARVQAITLIATTELYAQKTPRDRARTPTWLYVTCFIVVAALFARVFFAMFR
ncbi:MAG: hypothetical protein ACHREM_22780 [Polyangiales bacterium]